MGVLKSGKILQPISHRPIHGAMAQQYQSGQQHPGQLRGPTDDNEGDANALVMEKVIGNGARPRPRQVAQHAYIREEQQQGEQPPRVGEKQGGRIASKQQGKLFGVQQYTRIHWRAAASECYSEVSGFSGVAFRSRSSRSERHVVIRRKNSPNELNSCLYTKPTALTYSSLFGLSRKFLVFSLLLPRSTSLPSLRIR